MILMCLPSLHRHSAGVNISIRGGGPCLARRRQPDVPSTSKLNRPSAGPNDMGVVNGRWLEGLQLRETLPKRSICVRGLGDDGVE